MIGYILSVTLFFMAWLLYKWVIRPMKQKKHYAKLFRDQGFKVLELPFKPLGAPYYEMITKAFKEKKDSFYHNKHHFHQYDLIVSNVLQHPQFIVLKFDVVKELISPEKVTVLHKHKGPYQVLFSFVKKGIVAVEDDYWKKKKKMISKVFNYDFIVSQIPVMAKVADITFDTAEKQFWEKNPELRSKGQISVKLFQQMTKYTSSVVMSGFLGLNSLKEQLKGQPVQQQILRWAILACQALKDPVLVLLGQKFLKLGLRQRDRQMLALQKDINQVLQAYVTDQNILKQVGDGGHNILQLLKLEMQKSDQKQKSFDENDLMDQIKTFIVAGSETTSNFLNAMILYTFEKPEVVQKLRKEVNQIIKSDKDITADNLKKMAYLDLIIAEVSRMFCSGTGLFDRQVVQETTLGGVPLQKGIVIFAQWISEFYNPQTFQNPFEFQPQRWERDDYKEKQNLPSFIFSGGPRGCIGKSLALAQMKVMMIKFMKRYEKLIEPVQNERVYELQLTYHLESKEVKLIKNKINS